MPVRRVFWILFFLFLLLLYLGCTMDSEPVIVIDTFVNPYSACDTYLYLFDAAGNLIAEDDDGNPDQVNHEGCSRIKIIGGLSSGIYYIKLVKVNKEPSVAFGNANYGIRIVDYDPGASMPATNTTTNEDDGGTDDAIDGTGVDDGIPTNPVPINVGDVLARAISPLGDIDWFKLIIP
jgi:hypothetical protein